MILSTMKEANLILLVVINIFMQAVSQWLIITEIGIGIGTDDMILAMLIPQFVLSALAISISKYLAPEIISNYENSKNINKHMGMCIRSMFLIVGVASIFVVFPMYYWSSFFFGQRTPEYDTMLILFSLSTIFSAANLVTTSYHLAAHRFIYIEKITLLVNILGLGLIYTLVGEYGIVIAAIAYLFKSLLFYGLSILKLQRAVGSYKYREVFIFSINILKKIKHLIFGSLYFKSDAIVDRTLQSRLASGTITSYNVALQLYAIAEVLIEKVVKNQYLVLLSKNINGCKLKYSKKIYYRALIKLLLSSIVIMLSLFIIGKDVLNIIFLYKNIDPKSIDDIYLYLQLLSGVFIGGVFGQITSVTFYKAGKMKEIVMLELIIFSFFEWGIYGLCFATSIYYIVSFIAQHYYIVTNNFWVAKERDTKKIFLVSE